MNEAEKVSLLTRKPQGSFTPSPDLADDSDGILTRTTWVGG